MLLVVFSKSHFHFTPTFLTFPLYPDFSDLVNPLSAFYSFKYFFILTFADLVWPLLLASELLFLVDEISEIISTDYSKIFGTTCWEVDGVENSREY